MPERSLPLAAESLLPHKGRMCCIDSLTALAESGAEAELLLCPDSPLVDKNGRIDPCGFIELAAQTAGAMYGARAIEAPLRSAMLVSIQKVTVRGSANAGDALRICVSILGEVGGMISLAFSVTLRDGHGQGGPPLAEGRLTVFVPEKDAKRVDALTNNSAVPGGSAFLPPAPGNGLPEAVAVSTLREPRIIEQVADEITLEGSFYFTPDFPGFDGHFPGNPILPGIVQIMAAIKTAAGESGVRLNKIKRCKFLRPVLPGEELRVLAKISGPANERQCQAQLFAAGSPCSDASFSFGFAT